MTSFPVSDDSAQVRQILEPGTPTLPPEASLQVAARLMKGQPHSCLWVVKNQTCVGVLTEQEIFQAVASGLDLAQTPVSQFMLLHSETLRESESILQALNKLQRSHLNYFPVLDSQGSVTGLVTRQGLYQAALSLQSPSNGNGRSGSRSRSSSPMPKRETYLATLVLIHQELLELHQRNRLQVFNRILKVLGLATNVSRVYLFENHVDAQGRQVSSQRAEWCNQGIRPEIDNPMLQNIAYQEIVPRWYDLLSQGEMVVGPVSQFPASEQEVLKPQGVQSLLVLPLRTEKSTLTQAYGQFYGFIGFDDCLQRRQWDIEEINLLKAVTASLSLAYEHQQVQRILNQTQTVFSSVFQCSPDPISIATFPEGRYLAVNSSFGSILAGGTARSHILGQTPTELGLVVNPRQVVRLMRQLRQHGSVASQEIEYCQGSRGPVKTLLVSCELIEFEGQTCVLAVCKDISDRKEVETALRESEARFRAIFEQTNVGICLADLSGRMVKANPGLCSMLGYSQEELSQKVFAEITHPEDVERDWGQHQQLLAGKIQSFSMEKRYLHRAGHAIWVNLTVCLVRDSEGAVLFSIGVSQAINDRKATELALCQSQERYALATQESRVGVWDWDLTTGSVYVSPNLKSLLGYSESELPNQFEPWIALVHPEDQPQVLQAIQAHLEGRSAEVALSHRRTHKDGSIRWILTRGVAFQDELGQPVRMAGTDTDITDLKYAEEALIQSHRRVADILESITDAFIALDESWRFTYVNQRAEQLLQQSREWLLGKVIWQEFPAVLQTRFFAQFYRATRRRISLTIEEYYPPFDAWYEVHIYPTRGGLAVYFQDISDRKRTYAQLQQQIRREQALNRVLQAIRQSLDLDTIFSTAAAEISTLLQIDQVTIWLYRSQENCWQAMAEHPQGTHLPSVIGMTLPDQDNSLTARLKDLEVIHIDDTDTLENSVNQAVAQRLPGAWLLAPLNVQAQPWGCLALRRSHHQSPWQTSDIELVKIVADQLAIAIQQANTLEQAHRELEERQRAEARLKQAQRISHTGNWEWHLDSGEITWSEEMFHIHGLPVRQRAPRQAKICSLVHPEDRETLQQLLEQAIRTGAAYSLELRLLRPDGSLRHVQLLGQSRQNERYEVVQLFGTLMDITQRKQIEERLVYEALHDALTGAPNRTCFMEQLGQAIELVSLQPGYAFAVLFIDLDRFKVINDSLGHLVGDQLLVECTQRLLSIVRADDLVARLGGDEFAILLTAVVDIQEALQVAERIHEVLRQPFELEGREIFISASIGISSNLTGSLAAVDFLRDADTAMYRAKEQGRGRSALFDPTMYEQVNLQLTLENDLRRALERQELELYYQPIFDLQQQQLIGFEALVRWHHPHWGCIQPSMFVPLAEETGLILPIGTWTMKTASEQLKQWHDRIPASASLVMGVNLSVKQFASPNLIHDIDTILADTGLESSRLRLEITESALIDNPETAEAILAAIKTRGVQLCIDDFGTGYSSLSVVHRFPVHILKIDRSFVSRMEEDHRGVAMVQAILALAQSLGMVAIAEGVETNAQLQLLQGLACPYAQGYWFAMPMPAAEAEALIQNSMAHLSAVKGCAANP
ncbi:MAG TPA: PAS domain S-box protein [Trichocoleus sp.]